MSAVRPRDGLDAEDILRQLDGEAAAEEAELIEDSGVIPVRYRLANGAELVGDFEFQLPNVRDRMRIGVVAAGLRGGMPEETIDVGAARLIAAVAFLTVVLTKKPAWAEKLGDIPDDRIVLALAERIRDHALRFRNAGRDLAASPAAGV